MEIKIVGSDELGNDNYTEAMKGVYICPASGKVLIVQDDERCLLISKK
ncbi:MAG: hypothetical protein JZU49_00325 [Sulfuricurvum sp.]|nr:hypothetical protein [Sulfuricurvum sp.]